MADIKPEITTGKTLPSSEKPLAGDGNLKQKSENIAEEQRVISLEQAEQAAEKVISEISREEGAAPPAAIGQVAGVTAPMAKRQKRVESVLAQGLADIYLSLTPRKRREFKIKGEQTADKINKLLAKTRINIGEIIKLIKKWLSLIPGINKYFLEKEAKIKADELIKLKN